MTDRIRSLHVQLSRDVRVDDAETIINAIRMIKGVSDVSEGDVVGYEEHMKREAAVRELILLQMEFLGMYLGAGVRGEEKLKQIKALLSESHREKFGGNLFG